MTEVWMTPAEWAACSLDGLPETSQTPPSSKPRT